jgi:tRNA pseudouridine38-40 synthase
LNDGSLRRQRAPVEKAAPRFHARHDAKSRTYLYRVSRRRTAFDKRLVWWIKDRLDVPRCAARRGSSRAARLRLVLREPGGPGVDDRRRREERGPRRGSLQEIHFRITASHFLWKMVRRLAGALVEVGRGRLDAAAIERLLAMRSGEPAKWTAPPSGLFLERVVY